MWRYRGKIYDDQTQLSVALRSKAKSWGQAGSITHHEGRFVMCTPDVLLSKASERTSRNARDSRTEHLEAVTASASSGNKRHADVFVL